MGTTYAGFNKLYFKEGHVKNKLISLRFTAWVEVDVEVGTSVESIGV